MDPTEVGPRSGRARPISLIVAGIVVPLALIAAANSGFAAERPKHANNNAANAAAANAAAANPAAANGANNKAANKAAAAAAAAAAPAVPNPNCTLLVPANPLTAQGLATPYQLTATNPAAGPCNEAVKEQAAFVEATVIDPATGMVGVYHPLVTDMNLQPAAPPVVPNLPPNAVVGVWFGFNGTTLTLKNAAAGAMAAGNCVNGLPNSPFGQFAYCNAVAFFQAANNAMATGKINMPAAQTGTDGMPCPTTRDFRMIDQDQSDNVVSAYLTTITGQTAQFTPANQAALPGSTKLTNASDNGLLDNFIDPALGCKPLTAPDLGNPGAQSASLALNEMQAAVNTSGPMALVPVNDPMTLNNAKTSVAKANLYRAGVDQPPVAAPATDGATYCQNMTQIGPAGLGKDQMLFTAAPSPNVAMGANLMAFLTQRLQTSFQMLGCAALLGIANPMANMANAMNNQNNAMNNQNNQNNAMNNQGNAVNNKGNGAAGN